MQLYFRTHSILVKNIFHMCFQGIDSDIHLISDHLMRFSLQNTLHDPLLFVGQTLHLLINLNTFRTQNLSYLIRKRVEH